MREPETTSLAMVAASNDGQGQDVADSAGARRPARRQEAHADARTAAAFQAQELAVLAAPQEPPALVALLDGVHSLTVDSQRLTRAALLTALNLGQQLMKTSDYLPSEDWENRVAVRTPLTVDEAVAMLVFFAKYNYLIDRMTPASSVHGTQLLSALMGLANSARAATSQTYSQGAIS